MNWIDENLDKWKWAVSVTKEELRPLIEEAYQRGVEEERKMIAVAINEWKITEFTRNEDITLAYRKATLVDDLISFITNKEV